MLRVEGIFVSYGEVKAVRGVSLDVKNNSIVALVGSNGAGKTTLLKSIAGLLKPKQGTIHFCEQDITFEPAHTVSKYGVVLVPEGRKLFKGMNTEQNLILGAYNRKLSKNALMEEIAYIFELFPPLKMRRNSLAGNLSGGEQQMCAIGRGLMAKPQLMLIDELSLGLAPIIAESILEALSKIRDDGVSLLLVEQDVQTAFEIADYGYIMETGKVVDEGQASHLINKSEIRRAYFGI